MKLRLGWAAGTVAALIFFLLKYLPASQVLGRVDLPRNMAISGVSGTIWNGQAELVSVSGLSVTPLNWEIHPLALLVGRVSADIRGGNLRESGQVAFQGPLSISLFDLQSVKAEDFLLFLPVDRVLAKVRLPLPVNAGGRIRLKLDALEFGPECEQLIGSGDWLNATVAGTQGPIDFGSYNAQLTCSEGKIALQVKEPNKLGLTLNATVSADLADISAQGQFKLDPSLPREVHDAAMLFSRPEADGYTRFKL
ncbi:type II secretion system protein N [Alteromonas aestuariivivens]|uniref:Type II secretion system protein N n=1 Tax=Alteromonas aestuariivivens TaxID=1938339 RepID=A0A3D8M5H4_9ALTE|nr:type II secretion system protein N [Alteromonas aestuariivivens]RDV24871.1 type II secretion system protein N [Alteromonas aestuariivivens]